MFTKIKTDFCAITIFSIMIGILDQNQVHINIPIATPTILGTAISLLLAFRTAQAYDRWWEARIIWGAIVNTSRTLIRELSIFLNTPNNEIVENFTRRQIAWCYALGERLRGESQLATLEKYLTQDEIEAVKNHDNIPNAILDLHGVELKKMYEEKLINEFQQIKLDETISVLCDCMGKCERIKTTVFPRTYSTLLHFLIYVFAAMLPFSLTNYNVYIEVSLSIIISLAFILIENTAIYKQDPFEGRPTDIAVTAIARTIEINLRQMTGNKLVPKPLEPVSYYIM
jgi:putative membrane protein